jgi:glycosyltransferase involved in cell wall biosynthesis
LTHEVARRLVAQGDEVEWFAGSFPGAPREESIDGIRLRRAGTQWSVHWRAFQRYRQRIAKDFDVVVDEVNTIPFFTPIWADLPRVMLIFQLAREVWWYETPLPLSALGYYAERYYLSCYRNTSVLTISRSTEIDLRQLGFKGEIAIIPVGAEPMQYPHTTKAQVPTFIYVGRLAPSKRVSDIVSAFSKFHARVKGGQLWIVGDGEERYRRELVRLAARLGVGQAVQFLGRLPEREKRGRMAQAHAIVLASVREGWGLVVTEAGTCGTPALVYNVPGLRDAVVNGKTGIVVDPFPDCLAEAMHELWTRPDHAGDLGLSALEFSLQFTFDRAAMKMRQAIERALAA